MPQAMCAGSSEVWLKTVYVATMRKEAITISAAVRITLYRSRKPETRSAETVGAADWGPGRGFCFLCLEGGGKSRA